MANKTHDRLATDLPIGAVVVTSIVDDPLEPGSRLRMLQNVRDDPLALMRSRDAVDGPQYKAGRLWQQWREWAEVGGGVRAINPMLEAVDGGRFKEPDITRMSRALVQLERADRALQVYEMSLVHDVLVRNMTITEIAAARSVTSGRQISYLMERFRGALDVLARLWGLA